MGGAPSSPFLRLPLPGRPEPPPLPAATHPAVPRRPGAGRLPCCRLSVGFLKHGGEGGSRDQSRCDTSLLPRLDRSLSSPSPQVLGVTGAFSGRVTSWSGWPPFIYLFFFFFFFPPLLSRRLSGLPARARPRAPAPRKPRPGPPPRPLGAQLRSRSFSGFLPLLSAPSRKCPRTDGTPACPGWPSPRRTLSGLVLIQLLRLT